MGKRAAKGKISQDKKRNVSESKNQSSGNLARVSSVGFFVAALAIVLSFRRAPDNHKPFVGNIDVQQHYEEANMVEVEVLSLEPKVYMLRNVLSASECDELIEQAKQGHRLPSTSGSMINKTNSTGDFEWRRSTTSWLRKDEHYASDVVKKLVSRVAAASNVSTASLQRGNPLHVTEYEPSGHYWPHTDSLHLEDLDLHAKRKSYPFLEDGFVVEGGFPHSARYSTALCYLSSDFEGGETIFPLVDPYNKEQPTKGRLIAMQNAKSENTVGNWKKLLPDVCNGSEGLRVAPERGSCVLFYNHFLREDGSVGQLDRLSLHAGCTVRGGKKWIANVWAESIPNHNVREKARRYAAKEL